VDGDAEGLAVASGEAAADLATDVVGEFDQAGDADDLLQRGLGLFTFGGRRGRRRCSELGLDDSVR
jgi:hypothetical protein